MASRSAVRPFGTVSIMRLCRSSTLFVKELVNSARSLKLTRKNSSWGLAVLKNCTAASRALPTLLDMLPLKSKITPIEMGTSSAEDVPISIGVIFDFSGSMSNKVGKAREAAVQFFKTANPQDEFFLVSFNERAELTSSFTNSVEDLQSRMMLTVPKGRTALLDAIYLGLSQMRGAHNAKRALLILSDGGDNHSRYNESDIKRLVKEADTQLYAVGIFDPLGYRNRSPEELGGPSLLSEVTEMTGGRVFAVEKLDDLPDIASKIGMELRNQYVLGYRPSNKAHDARWRKLKIKLRAPKGLPPLSVYSKTGYYAPSH